MVMLRAFVLIAVLGFTAGCGDDIVPTTPTPDRPQAPPENFSGTLTVNGAATHPFTTGSGLITATLNTVGTEGATIGVSLGTWNGSACQIVIANDNANQGAVVVGNASTTGSFCVRVYDVGRLGRPTDYSLTVVHF